MLSILEWTESSFRLHWLFWVDLYQLSWEFSAHIKSHLQTSNVNARVSKLNPVPRHCVLQTWHNWVLLIFHYSWADCLVHKIHLLCRWGWTQAASIWRQLWSIRVYYFAFRPIGGQTLLLWNLSYMLVHCCTPGNKDSRDPKEMDNMVQSQQRWVLSHLGWLSKRNRTPHVPPWSGIGCTDSSFPQHLVIKQWCSI